MSDVKTLILTIVRHGQTNANQEKLVHGFTDTPLNETGEKQAETAGKALQNVLFHKAYSSDLKRTMRTCEHIIEQNKVSNISVGDIIKDERLREQNFGKFENMPVSKWIEMAMEAKIDPPDFTLESAESPTDVRNRAWESLKNIISENDSLNEKESHILVVSHGLTIRQIIKIFFEDFGCTSKVPGINDPTELLIGKNFRATCLNTCRTKFVLKLSGENNDVIKSVECLEVFNSDHLEK